mmetsp:Transcript_6651/g.16596  ORF Transcript_6651/g.16596 Transcript_6651/m.16596 type:complete len:91 (+) Transcript_6651:151-423(+)
MYAEYVGTTHHSRIPSLPLENQNGFNPFSCNLMKSAGNFTLACNSPNPKWIYISSPFALPTLITVNSLPKKSLGEHRFHDHRGQLPESVL